MANEAINKLQRQLKGHGKFKGKKLRSVRVPSRVLSRSNRLTLRWRRANHDKTPINAYAMIQFLFFLFLLFPLFIDPFRVQHDSPSVL